MTMLKPSLWRRIVNNWRHDRRRRGCAIDLTPDGFVLTLRWRENALRWADVDRIDAGIHDCLSFDVLYFELFAGARRLLIEEFDDGFRQFENAILERWPQIREGWNALHNAPAQYHTLWQRRV